jgi:hypothetical protein
MDKQLSEIVVDLDTRLARLQLALDTFANELGALRQALEPLRAQADVEPTRDEARERAWEDASPDGPPIESGRTLTSLATRIFELAIGEESEDAFEAFLALVHLDDSDTGTARQSLRAYTWPQLRKNAASYLQSPNAPGSFRTVRRDPEETDPAGEWAKWFFWSSRRSPAPITFRRDARRGRAWRISQCSL